MNEIQHIRQMGEVFHPDDNVIDLPCKTIKMAKKNT